MEIVRINSYNDPRFAQNVLLQHGAFLADDEPCSFEIIGRDSAVLCCPTRFCQQEIDELLDEFRFYAEHITTFYNKEGVLLRNYPPVALFSVELSQLQPSQFYVDEDKLAAISSFVKSGEDVIIPLTPEKETGRFVSLDGHTRLYRAYQLGCRTVYGFLTEDTGGYIRHFVAEAKKQGVFSPCDIVVLPHEQYRKKWDDFCDAFFHRTK